MNYFTITKHNENLYQIKDLLGVCSTIIIGSKQALVIDTCYGIADLLGEIKKITNKELIVVNSHGHMDHSCGNYQFDKVLIHPFDYELVKEHNNKEMRLDIINTFKSKNFKIESFNENEYLNKNEGNISFLEIDQVFELGGINIKVVKLFGHTLGSVAFYVEEMKLMITSDGICPYVWLFLDESDTIDAFIDSTKLILEYDFNYFISGHSTILFEKKEIYKYLNKALEIKNNKDLKKFPYVFKKYQCYCYTDTFIYDPSGFGIFYK